MKTIYALAFGVSTFFAMNCGSGDGGGGYPSESGKSASPASGQSNDDAGSSAAPDSGSSSTSTADAEVKVLGHDFDPPEVKIKAGQTVRWVWVTGSHNVVSGSSCTPDGQFTSGSTTGAPKTFEHTFGKAGTFPYFCDPHCGLGMTGKVIVE